MREKLDSTKKKKENFLFHRIIVRFHPKCQFIIFSTKNKINDLKYYMDGDFILWYIKYFLTEYKREKPIKN